jgi:peptide/nickel transport system substrate-binding protein
MDFQKRVTRLLALTATTILAGAILATSTAASAVDAKAGGTLVFGRGGDSVGLDPASRTDGESLNVTDHIFDNLVTFKPGTTEVAPSLAESWTITPDGKTYTFKLVKGAKFHDGTPVNADAVVFSFKRQMDEKHPAYAFGSPYSYFEAMGFKTLIKDVKKTDDSTVVFELTKPNAPFISTVGMQAFAIVSPTAVLKFKKDFAQKPVGSGPYSLKVWEKKQKIVLEANNDYWGKKPLVKTVIFRAIPDNNARLQEMMAGNLHVMDNPDTNHIKALEQKLGKAVKFAKAPGFNVGCLAMNNEKKPFNDVRVRRAIAHAINKQAIIDSVYNGYARPAKNPMPPTLWGYNDAVEDYEYSPEKAKALLKEAGLEGGFETDLWAMPVPRPYMPDGRKVAEAIQGDLAKIGIKAKIVSYDWGTYLKKTSMGEHSMALLGWTGDIGDPDNFLYVLLDKDNAVLPAQNISLYKSDKLHDVLMKAQIESDPAKRTELYKQAQVIIHEDSPLVPIAHSEEIVPMKVGVENFIMDPTGRRRFAEVWLDK